jgi:hypothetical protein
VGSDGDFIGTNQYKRQKLAFFPFAGGTPATGDNTGDPHTVFLAGASGNSFTANSFDPTTGAGGPTSSPSNGGGIAWGSVTGGFVLNGRIWYGQGGQFFYRTWDGANAFGPAQVVNPYNDPYWDNFQTGSGQTYQSIPVNFYAELPSVTGLFYANRSIYYTKSGSKNLFSRAFSPDTRASSVANQVTGGVISPVENVVISGGSPVDFSNAGGMFVANGSLWYATKSDGKLHQAPWNGTTVTGPSTVDNAATGNWAADAVFVSPTTVVNGSPTANFTFSCTALACSFNASSSTAPGDTITSYAWDFGDTNTGSGVTTNHTYGSANTYNVKLTINTQKGGTANVTKQVTVSNVVPPGIAFVAQGTTNGNATTETVTVPPNVAAGNALVLVATGATGASLTAPAGWTLLGTSAGANASVTTTAWEKVASTSDHGSGVTVGFGSAIVHGTVQVLAYSGTNGATPVVISASKATQGTASSYSTPPSTVSANGQVVISVWSAKSSVVTGWTTPGGQILRSTANGSGSGRVNSIATDGGSATAGSAGNISASTVGGPASAAAAWTIVLGQ